MSWLGHEHEYDKDDEEKDIDDTSWGVGMLRLDYMIGILRLAYMTVVKELPSRAHSFISTELQKFQQKTTVMLGI